MTDARLTNPAPAPTMRGESPADAWQRGTTPLRIGWVSDTHRSGYSRAAWTRFCARLRESRFDLLLGTGDYVDAFPELVETLAAIQGAAQCPFAYTGGNHDAWHALASVLHEALLGLSRQRPDDFCWLTARRTPIWLTPHTALVGGEGWYDGRGGDGIRTRVVVKDESLIADLLEARITGGRYRVFDRIAARGDRATAGILTQIDAALETPGLRRVLIATHFPPFPDPRAEPHLENAWAPFSQNIGLAAGLRDAAAAHPHVRFHVLSGHTHRERGYTLAHNLSAQTFGVVPSSTELPLQTLIVRDTSTFSTSQTAAAATP